MLMVSKKIIFEFLKQKKERTNLIFAPVPPGGAFTYDQFFVIKNNISRNFSTRKVTTRLNVLQSSS